MKYHFLGTFCTLFTIVGITVATAQADVSPSIPTSQPDPVTSQPNPATNQTEVAPMPEEKQIPAAAAPKPAPALNSLELTTYKLVNRYRLSRNLPPLEIDPAISAEAKAHSEEMAKVGHISHDGFNNRVESVAKTIVYRSAAENVAYNVGHSEPDLVAVQGWIESPGHKQNMIGRYDLTGIGVVKNARGEYYFTQIFIRKAWYVKDAD
jgi:uncharacterized protein YkwD